MLKDKRTYLSILAAAVATALPVVLATDSLENKVLLGIVGISLAFAAYFRSKA